jgi:transposase
MSAIPTRVTHDQFNEQGRPYLSTAPRGDVSKIPLDKLFNYGLYRLHTGCPWKDVPIDKADESTCWAVYHHYRQSSREGSLPRFFEHSIQAVTALLDLSGLKVDGSDAVAKKGGEAVAYQGRKKPRPAIACPLPTTGRLA